MNAPRQAWRRLLFASRATSRIRFVPLVHFIAFQILLSPLGAAAQTCPRSESVNHLEINGVTALLRADEMQFFDFGRYDKPRYEVPAGSGTQSLFIANLMIAGKVNGETKAITASYGGQSWPGPLDVNGNPTDDCTVYDRVFRVSLRDIDEFEKSGYAAPDLLEWPWRIGAPVKDGDGVPDNYDLAVGDRPAIEGHQMLWWVMNDKGHATPNPYNPAIGLEIQVSAFAVSSEDPVLEFATLYRYRLTHRGEAPLMDAYFGQLVDPDLGGYNDDLVGSDTAIGLAFAYNGDNFDEGSGESSPGYGERPPAVGVAVIEGILSEDDDLDNDKDGFVDEQGERQTMSKFVVWWSDGTVQGNPDGDEDFYRYLRGVWRDDGQITYGGSGRGFSQTPVDFMYPGQPPAFWSLEDIDGLGNGYHSGDYRFMWSTGPFSLDVGESTELVIAFLWAQGEDRYDSIRKLKEAVPKLRAYWDDGFQIPLPEPPSVVPELFAPDNRSTGQPTNLRLSWQGQPNHGRHEVQVSRNANFASLTDSAFTASSFVDFDVTDDATYYWRVRGVNAGGYGPWSKPWSFSTGSIEQVAPGPLDIDGFETWAFIQVEGAEGENDACNPAAESRFGCDEVGGNVVYGSFNGARTWIMYQATVGPETSIGRFAPRDFELRFTVKGSYGYHAETTGRVIHVPFEGWDIGPVGPFGTNEPSDDIQLIPGLYSDNEGECFFGFGETPDDPFGLGWPVTDRIHAYYPADGSTYEDWEAAVKPLVDASTDGCPASPTTDPAAQFVDVDRRPIQNLIFMMDPSAQSYRPEGIPIGNVIRFLTTKPTPPVPSAPADEATFYVIGSLDRLSLWWQLPPGIVQSRVEVTRTRDGTEVVVDSVVSGSTIELENLLVGAYSWRVSYSADTEFWSEPSRFAVLSFASTEDELAEIPAVLTLREPYPNPTDGLAHFDVGLPETGRVRLTAYDLLGRRVLNIADDPMAVGWRTVDWNTAAVSNGVYVVRLQAGGAAVSKNVVVVR